MQKILFSTIFFLSSLFGVEKLEKIEVISYSESEYDEVIEYIEKESFLKNAPMQKQISVSEAVHTAGSNGDPIAVIKTFAGVVTSSDNSNELYIHGSKPRESQISINHLPIGYLYHLGGVQSVIAPESISQIDLYLGGFDVSYGDAMGGVADITPNYPESKFAGRVHIGMYEADFALTTPIGEDTTLFLSGRRSYFDFIADDIMSELDKDEDNESKKVTFTLFPQFYDAQMTLTHFYKDHIFSLEVITAEDEMKLNSNMEEGRDPLANGKINQSIGFTTIGARWQYFGEDFNSHTLLSKIDFKENTELFDNDMYVKVDIEQHSLFHETNFEIKNHKILAGFEIAKNSTPVKADIVKPPENDFEAPLTKQERYKLDKTFEAETYTGFIQDIWKLTETDYLRYGLRFWDTSFQEFSSGIDPRISYIKELNSELSLAFSVGQYSQFPNDLYIIEEFGNPEIDTIEKSNHYILSLKKDFGKNSSFIFEPYYKTFHNLAIIDEVKKYDSVGEGSAYGFDFTYRKKIDKLDLILAYTYIRAEREVFTDSSKNYRFEGDIPHTLQISANYRFSNSWRISSILKYSSGSPYTPILKTESYEYEGKEYFEPIYGDPYSERLADNFDLDIQIGKLWKYENDTSLEFALELMNIASLFYDNETGIRYNEKYEKIGIYQDMTFLPAIHLTYRF